MANPFRRSALSDPVCSCIIHCYPSHSSLFYFLSSVLFALLFFFLTFPSFHSSCWHLSHILTPLFSSSLFSCLFSIFTRYSIQIAHKSSQFWSMLVFETMSDRRLSFGHLSQVRLVANTHFLCFLERCWESLLQSAQMVSDGVRMPTLRAGQSDDHSSVNCANCWGQREHKTPGEDT